MTRTEFRTATHLKNWQSMNKCCLDISLFNRYQEGVYLASTYHWISSRFDKCFINLGDTLHRHNLHNTSINIEEAHKKSRALGDSWIIKNNRYLTYLKIPHKIIRNDDWLEDKEFEQTHESLWKYFYTNKSFRKIVEKDVETFIARRHDMPADIVRRSSLAYLIEETTADILLGKRESVAHLYPGNRHQCYWYLIEYCNELPPMLRGLENSAFKRMSPAKISFTLPDTDGIRR